MYYILWDGMRLECQLKMRLWKKMYIQVIGQQIEEQLDAGPVLIKQEIELNENSTAGQVEQRLSEIGADKILEAIHLIEKKEAAHVAAGRDGVSDKELWVYANFKVG